MINKIKSSLTWIYILIGLSIGSIIGYSAYTLINGTDISGYYFIFYALICVVLFVGIYFLVRGIDGEYKETVASYIDMKLEIDNLKKERDALKLEIEEILSRYSTINVNGGDLDD